MADPNGLTLAPQEPPQAPIPVVLKDPTTDNPFDELTNSISRVSKLSVVQRTHAARSIIDTLRDPVRYFYEPLFDWQDAAINQIVKAVIGLEPGEDPTHLERVAAGLLQVTLLSPMLVPLNQLAMLPGLYRVRDQLVKARKQERERQQKEAKVEGGREGARAVNLSASPQKEPQRRSHFAAKAFVPFTFFCITMSMLTFPIPSGGLLWLAGVGTKLALSGLWGGTKRGIKAIRNRGGPDSNREPPGRGRGRGQGTPGPTPPSPTPPSSGPKTPYPAWPNLAYHTTVTHTPEGRIVIATPPDKAPPSTPSSASQVSVEEAGEVLVAETEEFLTSQSEGDGSNNVRPPSADSLNNHEHEGANMGLEELPGKLLEFAQVIVHGPEKRQQETQAPGGARIMRVGVPRNAAVLGRPPGQQSTLRGLNVNGPGCDNRVSKGRNKSRQYNSSEHSYRVI